jgi:hypothetical protein
MKTCCSTGSLHLLLKAGGRSTILSLLLFALLPQELLLQPCVPVILNIIISSPW